jgi:CheY-like chemotaxis protein
MGDSGQLFQVFLNLALNARDAMPEGGRLTFRTHAAGGRLVVEVEDSGHGIPEDVRPRIFDPFFTTKGAKGAGMGLAVARTVVEGHGGSIEVESRPGEGTVFRVSLPTAKGVQGAPEPEAASPPSPDLGDVLVVDDEDVVRQVVARMLAQLGCRAVCFGGCHDALEHFRLHHKGIGFVVLDMVMPEMTGRECFERLRAIDPQAKVLISSGFGRDAPVEALLAQGGACFLEKPYRLAQLRQAISTLLP